MPMRRWLLIAGLVGCGEAQAETPPCAWEEPLGEQCARFVATDARLSLEGRSCEPVSCLVVPFGSNEGTVQQVEVNPPEGFEVETGPCAALTCP